MSGILKKTCEEKNTVSLKDEMKLSDADLEKVTGGGVAQDYYCIPGESDDNGVVEFEITKIP